MRAYFFAVLVSGVFLAGCGQDASTPILSSPVSPTAVTGSDATGVPTPSADNGVQVPFRSDVVWEKVEGSQVGLCTRPLPPDKVYLQRNTITGHAVSTHLGAGGFDGHTCVYGSPTTGPQGWFMEVRWTAANGDALLATSEFLRWTGTPMKSVAIDRVTFQDGGTGRFQFAEGEGTSWVNAPERTARYEGTLRYGKKAK
jgi:hypothetical protein